MVKYKLWVVTNDVNENMNVVQVPYIIVLYFLYLIF